MVMRGVTLVNLLKKWKICLPALSKFSLGRALHSTSYRSSFRTITGHGILGSWHNRCLKAILTLLTQGQTDKSRISLMVPIVVRSAETSNTAMFGGGQISRHRAVRKS